MENKNKIISSILLKIRQIIDVHLSIEEQPLYFDNDIVLTPKEIKIIQVIGKSKKINIKELGDYFNTSKSAASQVISKLDKKGFVRKEKPVDNNKEFKLSLTESGKEAFTTYQTFRNSHISSLTESINTAFNRNDLNKTHELLELLETKMKQQVNKMI